MHLPTRTAFAVVLLATGLGASTSVADASSVDVDRRILTVRGSSANDAITLRVRAKRPGRLEVDLGNNGSADFRIPRSRFDRIRVKARRGNDKVRIDESKRVFTTTTPTTLDGQQGDDRLYGGAGAERLVGGPGKDRVDGNRGDDTASLDAGADTFVWDPGDGNDVVRGRQDADVLVFNGSDDAEQFDVSPDGTRALVARTVGNVTIDLDGVERIDVAARADADTLVVADLAGTDVRAVNGDLGDADNAQDQAIVTGTASSDAIDAAGSAGSATVTGLAATVGVTHAEPTRDQLVVDALGGDDRVSAAALAATTLMLIADGGADADTLLGGENGDVLRGGSGADAVDGNQGNDIALLGANDDRFVWDSGDGSDTVEGQTGKDAMTFNGSSADEQFDVSPSGGRVRLTRDVGSIVMDLDDVDQIDIAALGGADRLDVNDLSATDLRAVSADLASDGAADSIRISGSNGGDVITATGTGGNATVSGLAGGLVLAVAGAENSLDTLAVGALAGEDVIDSSALAANAIRLAASGGAAADVLIGGSGDETADGGPGDDMALLGAGADRFTWNPGDGNDTIEGQAGDDAMTFNGAAVGERFDVSANGGRVRFVRDVGSIVMDLDDVEQIDIAALGGADRLDVNDLSGTDVSDVNADLAGVLGGADDDAAADEVIVMGTTGDDQIVVAGSAGSAGVAGLSTRVDVSHANAADDLLGIMALAGDDMVEAFGLGASAIRFGADGGNGDDGLIGGVGDDMLRGSAGDDVLRGGPGIDVLDGGAGNNTVIQD